MTTETKSRNDNLVERKRLRSAWDHVLSFVPCVPEVLFFFSE